ncbi:MAG: alpha-ribazole phosphatase [Proteobacteria bacterium]|nr:alpha-ribazole phosphatase [Pseudomonadota bacterium]
MSTIYLLRHGALAADCSRHFIGQIDLPLAAAGVRQVEALAQALREREISVIYCSDLLRSLQTAQIIAAPTKARIKVLPGLREIALGEWEGQLRRDIATRFPEQFVARGRDIENTPAPGGESFAEVQQRLLPTWQRILAEGGENIAIAGHAGINRLLLCSLLGMPLANMFRLGQDYACINIIEQSGEQACVRLLNGHPAELPALPDDAPE